MSETKDNPGVIVHPPIALLIAFVAGLVLEWLRPLPFVPASIPSAWVGVLLFAAGLALLIWAFLSFRKAGTNVQTSEPATAIVERGPYGFSRNPIYTGMFLGLTGLAIGFDSLWVLAMLVPFYLVIRYGVIAREEAYLERKFGGVYLAYKSRVRRWL
ncbi:MAG TPA: isoprenylcysteine carboxylmethyltransferase family protein [Xanthobacteraceae bacterium]|jgi:protein-S-isoprenylcysteine O-methyltransferase Ste14